jgi:hypothetical protein
VNDDLSDGCCSFETQLIHRSNHRCCQNVEFK